MDRRGEMVLEGGVVGQSLERAGELQARVELLMYANKSLMHELAAVKLERARAMAELELAQRRAQGLEQVCASDGAIAARQRALANRFSRKLTRVRGAFLASVLVGLSILVRRVSSGRHWRSSMLA